MTPTEFLNRYQYDPRTDKLGSYNGGVVYKAYDRASRRDVAIKAVIVKEQPEEDDFSLKDDFAALQNVPQHRNIANYESLYTLQTSKGLYDFAIMPYFKDGNLAQQIRIGMSEAEKSQLAKELLEAINVLHEHKIVHCDLRPANILTIRKPKEVIPLVAFGMGMSYEPQALRYRAPEMLSTSRIHFCIDLWSFGAVVFELFTGKPLFEVSENENEESMYQKIMDTDFEQHFTELPQPWRRVVERCLVCNPSQRAQSTRELFDIIAQPIEEEIPTAVETVDPVSEASENENPQASDDENPDENPAEDAQETVEANEQAPETDSEESKSAEKSAHKSLLFNLAATAGVGEDMNDEEEKKDEEEISENEETKGDEEVKDVDNKEDESDGQVEDEAKEEVSVEEKKEVEVSSVRYWGTELAAQESQREEKPVETAEQQPEEEKDWKLEPTPMETDPFLPLNVEDDTKIRRVALICGIVALVLLGGALLWVHHSKKASAEQVEDTAALFEQPQLMLEDDASDAMEKEVPSRTKPIGEDATSCGEVTDVDGNTYATVKIGTQCWMKENLRTAHTPTHGDMIEGQTHNAKQKLYYPQSNYGYLYNWTAATNGEVVTVVKKGRRKQHVPAPERVQGICPDGWHLPTQTEWQELTDYVSKNYAFSGEKSYIGKPLAATQEWKSEETPNTVGHNAGKNNVTGFSAMPSGSFCDYYLDSRKYANFWSATPGDKGAYCLSIGYDNKEAKLHTDGKDIGYSVRCVKNNAE